MFLFGEGRLLFQVPELQLLTQPGVEATAQFGVPGWGGGVLTWGCLSLG